MLNKKPRIPAAVQIAEHLSFLQGYRDDLIAQTVSPHTRNAYLSDLIQCSGCHSHSMLDWSSDDISDVLLNLTKQGKSPRSIARSLSALRSINVSQRHGARYAEIVQPVRLPVRHNA